MKIRALPKMMITYALADARSWIFPEKINAGYAASHVMPAQIKRGESHRR